MTRLVEVCPEALSGVRSDVAATRDAVRDTVGPLRHRMVALGVPTGAMDEAQTMADRLGTHVLGTLDPYVARARDLAAMRYDGDFGATLPVVDDPDPFVPASPFTQTALAGGGSALTWSAAPVEEQEADERDTERSRGIGDWFGDRWDDLSGAVSDGVDRFADVATDAWDGVLDAGGQVADWWDRTSGDLGGWIDENLDGLRDFIGEHVAVFRVLATVCRVVGWVVVAVGAVLTIALAIIGGMGGAAIGGVLGFGVGAVPAGGAGVVAGLSFGLKVVGVGFTLVSVGDFLDVAADWGEGTIDGQQLVQQGSLELALAVTSLLGAGAVGKILQKTLRHLPASWRSALDDLFSRPAPTRPRAPFTSSDPFVADAANAIEAAFPGQVRDINNLVPMSNGLSREVDVDLGDIVVQVKEGNARGLTGQILKTEQTTGRRTIGFAPDMPDGAWQAAARQGIPIARSLDELVAMVGEMR
ncbi:hypothetical protein ACFO3K_04610 [Cellulomonas algicola]|uniref:hypothetical protein n=1 Tax=Cellulomonas algicola TaxID=2071633 RepID=UPI001C3FC903|nr:hypothetical protein [Cellulomonas algicola]